LERVEDHRYRATGSGPFALSVEGHSRDEALYNFRKAATAILPSEAELVTVDLPLRADDTSQHPWAWFAGILEDEPLFDAYKAEIERNREIDSENEARKHPS
jgi:hypothetical protein